jgi:polyisoprenoid-binding protein YceI
MAKWRLEPGHSAAEFCARHMMVTYVRGHVKNVQGWIEFDPARPEGSKVEARLDMRRIWSDEPERDAHLRSADFLDVEKHPWVTFRGEEVQVIGDHDFLVVGDLTIRGVTREATLRVRYLGQWMTPWWEDGKDKGPKRRAGFLATTTLDRHDFGVSWNAPLEKDGKVVGDEVEITIDAEAILED